MSPHCSCSSSDSNNVLHSTWSSRRGRRSSSTTTSTCPVPASPTVQVLLLLLLLLLQLPALLLGLTTDGVLLLSFKYAVLSDPLSVLSSWNYDDATPCAWNGVMCTSVPGSNTSRVIGLVLPDAKLLGSVTPDLALIEHLRHLDLSGNYLNGTLPSNLFAANASASELRVLSLAGNEISGDLPDLPAGSLTGLQVLNLSDNALTGTIPAGLSLLPNLAVLSLGNNYLSGGLPSGFDRADFIDLSSNLVNGTLPTEFGGGGSLRYLNLSYNRLAGEIPKEFTAKIPAGATVDLSFNNLTGAIPDSEALLEQKPRAFAGNSDLCGKPLKILCPIPSTLSDPPATATGTPTTSNSPPAFAAIPKTVSGAPTTDGQQSQGQGGLRPAAIAGIAAGDLVGIGLLFMVFLYVYKIKKKKKQQQQQDGRGIGPAKAENLVSKQQWTTSTSVTASETRGMAGGLSFCLGKKAGGGDDSQETSETTTGSDTEADDGGKGGDNDAAKSLNGRNQQLQQKKGGVLVTVDGETELELETLLKASAYILGATGSSIVYKAVLADGTAFAVRRIGESGGGAVDKLKDFEAQVRSIAKLRHPNLVGVRGFYWGSDEKLLIHDFAPNGSLANISNKKLGSSSSPYHLAWEARFRIARGVARGLAFLHEKKYVHGNLKPSNILLGPDMDPMIGDFGVERLTSGGDGSGSGKPGVSARHFGSKRSTLSQNSLQESSSPAAAGASPCVGGGAPSSASPYQAPESFKNLKPNPKWDVYSFGVLLLELLAGRVFSEAELCQWSAGFAAAEERSRVARMTDPTLRSEVVGKEEALMGCFKLGFSCVSVAPQKRPSMKDALQVLDRIPSSSSISSSSLA